MTQALEKCYLGSVVAIGGGHGLANLLNAIKSLTCSLTAVVTVADDGGSSGRLRRELGAVPPGDLRMCLAALAPEDSVLGDVMTYRFLQGELNGHALGNLILTALAETLGGMDDACVAAGEMLGIAGKVLPCANEPLELHAETVSGDVVGQVAVHDASGIKRIWVEPADVRVPDAVIAAVANADFVILGPGSLYTSVLAAAIAPPLRAAITNSKAKKVLVCNLREQRNETQGMSISDQIAAVVQHIGEIDCVLLDDRFCEPGVLEPEFIGNTTVKVAALSSDDGRSHDANLLVEALLELCDSQSVFTVGK